MMRAESPKGARASAIAACDFIDLSATPWRRIMLSERDNIWCLVSAVHYPWLSENKWNVSWGSRTPWQKYAKRNVGPDRATLRMHREIMMKIDPRSDAFIASHPVDHANGQTLDNRDENLAWVTKAENMANRHPRDSIPSLETIVLQLMREHGFAARQEVPF